MIECNVCDMPQETRLALTVKAEQYKRDFCPDYWTKQESHPPKKFRDACIIIDSLTGLVITLLEDKSLCE